MTRPKGHIGTSMGGSGKPVRRSQPTPAELIRKAAAWTCRICGRTNPTGVKYCDDCNDRLRAARNRDKGRLDELFARYQR